MGGGTEQFRWPKATSPPQELDVWGPEGTIHLVNDIKLDGMGPLALFFGGGGNQCCHNLIRARSKGLIGSGESFRKRSEAAVQCSALQCSACYSAVRCSVVPVTVQCVAV
jgi:hypothetical protein